MDTIELNSGKLVSFDYDLLKHGAVFYVITPLSDDEKKECTKILKNQRDACEVNFRGKRSAMSFYLS